MSDYISFSSTNEYNERRVSAYNSLIEVNVRSGNKILCRCNSGESPLYLRALILGDSPQVQT